MNIAVTLKREASGTWTGSVDAAPFSWSASAETFERAIESATSRAIRSLLKANTMRTGLAALRNALSDPNADNSKAALLKQIEAMLAETEVSRVMNA